MKQDNAPEGAPQAQIYDMDNSGDGPLRVPGFGGIPIDFELPAERRFAHAMAEWRQTTAVVEHELQMVHAMNQITNLPDWHVDVFDDATANHWRGNARATFPQLSDNAWNWCLRELRDKADEYVKKGFVRVLDTGSVVCKADSDSIKKLASQLAASTSHLFSRRLPSATSCEVEIVDPQLYPLIRGETYVLQDGGATTLANVFGTGRAEKAGIVASPTEIEERAAALQCLRRGNSLYDLRGFHENDHLLMLFRSDEVRSYFWSKTFQRLPCEIEAGPQPESVRITSYINNLHPQESQIYSYIEQAVALAIEPWNECLLKARTVPRDLRTRGYCSGRPQCGRLPVRIPSFGRTWVNELPLIALCFNQDFPSRTKAYHKEIEDFEEISVPTETENKYAHHPLQEYVEPMPAPNDAAWEWAEWYLTLPDIRLGPHAPPSVSPENWRANAWDAIAAKALERQEWLADWAVHCMPEPGIVLSYEDWRSGRVSDPQMVPMFTQTEDDYDRDRQNEPIQCPGARLSGPYFRGPILEKYEVKLREYLQSFSFQVIPRVWGIDLQPERPQSERSQWSIQGSLNEHVVATAIIALDSHNVTPCSIELRQETSIPSGEFDCCHWNQHFPSDPFNPSMTTEPENGPLAAQILGSIELPPGRLVTFPNTMEHRMKPIRLLDSSQAGYIRFLTLDLVDPNYRICSTRNVPAQQHDWWAMEIRPILKQKGLPMEICDMILDECLAYTNANKRADDNCKAFREELDLVYCAKYSRMKYH